MNTTDNYGLNLPETSDYADIAKLNENFQKLDDQALAVQAAKTAPVDADAVPLVDSADSSNTKLITWSNIKAALNNLYAAAIHTHAWSTITGKPSSFTPAAHAATHKTGGADAMTASDIGAAASSHTHGNITSAGQISGVTLDSTLVKLVSGALQTLGGTAIDRARIFSGSYVGTGAYATSNPTPAIVQIPLSVIPKLLILYADGGWTFISFPYDLGSSPVNQKLWIAANPTVNTNAWLSGNTLCLANSPAYQQNADWAFNISGKTYKYVYIE